MVESGLNQVIGRKFVEELQLLAQDLGDFLAGFQGVFDSTGEGSSEPGAAGGRSQAQAAKASGDLAPSPSFSIPPNASGSLSSNELGGPSWLQSCQAQCGLLARRVQSLLGETSTYKRRAVRALHLALEKLHSALVALERELLRLASGGGWAEIQELLTTLSKNSENFLVQYRRLRERDLSDFQLVKDFKPTNYARNLFHVGNGVLCVVLYQWVLNREQALLALSALLSAAIAMEISRKFSRRWNDFLVDRVFGAVSRPRERYVINSSSYYLVAVTLITYFLPKQAVLMALLVLAFGDPAASIVGKRWGRRKLWKEKSILGSLSFVVASFAACIGFQAVARLGDLAGSAVGGVTGSFIFGALLVAVGGAITELLTEALDDNLTVPIVCAILGALVF